MKKKVSEIKNESDTSSDVKKQIFRKGVSALILNKNQEVLLVNLRSFETKFYAVPGGGIEAGETLDDAAYREIKEELGISKKLLESVGMSTSPIKLLFKTGKLKRDGVEYDGMERFFFGFHFLGKDDYITLQSDEIRGYKWVTFSNLKDHLLFENQLEDTTEKLLELFPHLKR